MAKKANKLDENVVRETFGHPGTYWLSQVSDRSPSVRNGVVTYKRYRITVEEIEEPLEVLQERVQTLWSQSLNHHDWDPLRSVAKKLGFALQGSPGDAVSPEERKRRRGY